MQYSTLALVFGVFFLGCAETGRLDGKSGTEGNSGSPLGLEGCNFHFAREFTGKYCVDCHASWGNHGKKGKAVLNLKMDTYRDWLDADGAVPSVLDKEALEAPIMPPPSHPRQPTDAERRIIVDWVKRGSPNTDSGR